MGPGMRMSRKHELAPLGLNTASDLLVLCRRGRGRHGLAKKLSRAIIRRIPDLMSGGVVTEDNFADQALVPGEMGLFDETIIGVVFVLQDKSKLFLRSENLAAKKSSVLIQIPSNFLTQLPVLACCGGDGLVIGSIVFVNRARSVGIENDADANIVAILLGEGAEWGGGKNGESYTEHIKGAGRRERKRETLGRLMLGSGFVRLFPVSRFVFGSICMIGIIRGRRRP